MTVRGAERPGRAAAPALPMGPHAAGWKELLPRKPNLGQGHPPSSLVLSFAAIVQIPVMFPQLSHTIPGTLSRGQRLRTELFPRKASAAQLPTATPLAFFSGPSASDFPLDKCMINRLLQENRGTRHIQILNQSTAHHCQEGKSGSSSGLLYKYI